jgi:hypothetical protein
MIQDMAEFVAPQDTFIFGDQETVRPNHPFWSRALPFLEPDGLYGGVPASVSMGVAELEHMRTQGADYIVFASASFWLLSHYVELQEHLRGRFKCLVENEHVLIFDLRGDDD